MTARMSAILAALLLAASPWGGVGLDVLALALSWTESTDYLECWER